MKRIVVLTEEEKKRYADRAIIHQQRALIKKERTNRKVCPVCKSYYRADESRTKNCVGYCSPICANGRGKSQKPRRSEKKKRDDRQKRQVQRQNRINSTQPIEFYDSREWKELRFKVLRKYGFKCMACGQSPPAIILHVDHIKPRSKYPQLELNMDNLQVLCAHCNIGKCNYSEEDLRPRSG